MNREEYFEFIKNSENLRVKVNSDPYRLNFHLMPPTGWLNDPNGLCFLKGTIMYFISMLMNRRVAINTGHI